MAGYYKTEHLLYESYMMRNFKSIEDMGDPHNQLAGIYWTCNETNGVEPEVLIQDFFSAERAEEIKNIHRKNRKAYLDKYIKIIKKPRKTKAAQ